MKKQLINELNSAAPRQIEKTLLEIHERFASVLDSLDLHICIVDMKTQEILFTNQHMRNLFGVAGGRICRQTSRNGPNGPCSLFAGTANEPAGLNKSTDITWHKFNENAVKYEQQRLFTVLDSLPAYVSLIAPDYSIRFANRYFRERFGQPEGKTCYEMYRHANAPCAGCQTFNIFTTKIPQNCEWTSPDGDFYQVYDYPFTDLDGSPLILELGIDITEHKKAVENLRLSEERFSKAFYGSPNPMAIITLKDSCFTNVNDVLLDISGYTRDEIIGRTAKELNIFAAPEDHVKVQQLTREQGFTRNLEINFRMQSGEVRAGLLSTEIFELCGEQCILVSINDIHERKQAEELFRTLTHNSSVGIYIIQNGKFQFVNPQFRQYTHYDEDELIGMDSTALIVPEDRKMVREYAIKMLQGKRKTPYEYRLTRKDGIVRWMMETVAPIQFQKKPAVLGNCIDITWHKRTKKALRLSEERFSKAFHTSPNPLFIATLSDGRYIEANLSFYRTFGYSRQEVIGRRMTSLEIFVHPKDYHYVMQMPAEQGLVHNLETSLRTKSGEVRVVLLSADSIEIHGKQCLLGIINDITEMKQLRKEMARLERLNLVGEMAAGIGHEIRNPMTTVRGFLQILQNKKEYAEHKKYFHLMLEELDRANSIITEFLSLAKNRTVDLKLLNLNHVVQTLFPLIQADSMNADQYIETELTEIPDLLLDEKEIRQLILNLVRNGLEAMAPGGKLIIRTAIIGEDIVLSVQDQGPGIAPEVMEKIGTPFFTTKDTGTGLGLAVCYSIAARHNATIDIKTGPGGATFFIRFKSGMRFTLEPVAFAPSPGNINSSPKTKDLREDTRKP